MSVPNENLGIGRVSWPGGAPAPPAPPLEGSSRLLVARRELELDRARWIRLFNRLDAAISRHRAAKQAGGFEDEADEALADAHDKILKAAAER